MLDPIFGNPQEDNMMRANKATWDALSRPAYQRQAEASLDCLREDIASAKDDIREKEERAAEIRKELPKLEIELLVCERDAAEAKLTLIALRNKLDAKMGGAK